MIAENPGAGPCVAPLWMAVPAHAGASVLTPSRLPHEPRTSDREDSPRRAGLGPGAGTRVRKPEGRQPGPDGCQLCPWPRLWRRLRGVPHSRHYRTVGSWLVDGKASQAGEGGVPRTEVVWIAEQLLDLGAHVARALTAGDLPVRCRGCGKPRPSTRPTPVASQVGGRRTILAHLGDAPRGGGLLRFPDAGRSRRLPTGVLLT